MTNARYQEAKKATLIGAFKNAFLGFIKLIAGILFHSHGLIADSLHSFADIITDAMVLIASKYGSQDADDSHPYGHKRFETLATVLLALLLIFTGLGIIWSGLQELIHKTYQAPNSLALVIVFISIATNELLFRYTQNVGNKISSQLILAAAWHHRSDAASSLVVALGLIASILGYYFFDVLAAIVVGLMIIKMGVDYGWNSIKELVDTAAEQEIIQKIKKIIEEFSDVKKVHQLRTRLMGGEVFVDLHILVSPFISVSEGHFIAQQVHHRLIQRLSQVTDVTVHVDPEDDDLYCPSFSLPDRKTLETSFLIPWQQEFPFIQSWVIHYIEGEIRLDLISNTKPPEKLEDRIKQELASFEFVTKVFIYQQISEINLRRPE